MKCDLCGGRARLHRKGERERLKCDCGALLTARGWLLDVEARVFGRWREAVVPQEVDVWRLTKAKARWLSKLSGLPRRRPGEWIRVHTREFGARLVHVCDVRMPCRGPRGGRSYHYPFADQEAAA